MTQSCADRTDALDNSQSLRTMVLESLKSWAMLQQQHTLVINEAFYRPKVKALAEYLLTLPLP